MRMLTPNRRPNGIDQAKGSCIVATHLCGEALHSRPNDFIIAGSASQSSRCFVPPRRGGNRLPKPPVPRGFMTRNILHVGRKIRVALDTETLPDGRIVTRDVVLHPGAVAVLPLVDADHVCLLRNYRAVLGTTLWEVPAGTLE